MKKNILLICGGQSSEHEVSLRSGKSIYNALDKEKYQVITVGIQRNGNWRLFEDADVLFAHTNLNDISESHRKVLIDYNGSSNLLVSGENGYQPYSKIDCIVPVLHGPKGEDGTIQGLFEVAGIPYVGCDTASSAVCMDKATLKDIFAQHGIKQAKHIVIHEHTEDAAGKVESELTYPVFVKPANMGSSVGISKAKNREELLAAMKYAFRFDFKLVIENALNNMHEVECSVMGNESPLAAEALGEIIAGHEFYDYETKYIDDQSELVIPADFSSEVAENARALALRAYQVAGCSGLARVDMFIDKNNQQDIYINEINTLPGFTSISMYPVMWEKSGLPFTTLMDKLIEYGEQKFAKEKTLTTDMK